MKAEEIAAQIVKDYKYTSPYIALKHDKSNRVNTLIMWVRELEIKLKNPEEVIAEFKHLGPLDLNTKKN